MEASLDASDAASPEASSEASGEVDVATCSLPVESVRAEGQDHAISLSWSPAAAGATPTEYWVVIDGRSERTETTQLLVAGLRNGQEYSVVVYAATEAGRAEGSEPVVAIPSNGAEGVVAGLIVKFAAGVEDEVGTQDVAGERNLNVDLSITGDVTADAVLVGLAEPVSADEAETLAAQLEADPAIDWAEPDQFLFTSLDSSDSSDLSAPSVSTDAWNLSGAFGVDAPVGEGSAEGPDAGEGVTVAVIDTGVSAHPSIDSRLVAGYDFVSSPEQLMASRQPNAPPVAFDGDYVDPGAFGALRRDANPADPGDWRESAPARDSSWHGTAMAGVIAAVAPGARLLPVRSLSWRGGLLSDIAASITWASGGDVSGVPANANPAKVVNMSFSVEAACPTALQEAIDGARGRGAVLVAAAGNASDDASKYAPGNCSGVITVGSTNSVGSRANYSNYGPVVDISAPGGDNAEPVFVASNDGIQAPGQPATSADFGTSISAAHVSGGAAVLAAANPAITPDDAYLALTGRDHVKGFASATCDANPDYSCGAGILSLAQVATVVSGDEDFSMAFNGTNQYAQAGDNGAFELASAFTVEAWVKPANSCVSASTIIQKTGSYAFYCQGGTWRFSIIGPTGATATDTGIPVRSGEWQHIAYTRADTNSGVNFYLNDQPAYSGSAVTGSVANTTNAFTVAVSDTSGTRSNYYNGNLDETRIWSTERSAAQILADMHTYGPTNATGLAVYYDFNEGPSGGVGGGTVLNRVVGASRATNVRAYNGPTYADITVSSVSGSRNIVTFPRSYLTSAGGWRVPGGITGLSALLIGGGGGGAGRHGGGGGAGGLIDRYTSSSVTVTGGTAYPIVVGQGGAGAIGSDNAPSSYDTSTSGQSSIAFSLTADGGGKGVVQGSAGDGGSGGGKYSNSGSGGQPTGNGVGFAGGIGYTNSSTIWAAGGGGGAGGVGGNATSSAGGTAGAGLANSITGSSVTYAAGGSGGFNGGSLSGAGANGTVNLGNGGGGAGSNTASVRGGNGGTGVVIVSYNTGCFPTETTYTSGASTYHVLQWLQTGLTCTWEPPGSVSTFSYLVVGGGGGGGGRGGRGNWSGGGGGGGQVVSGTVSSASAAVSIVVGGGGAGGPAGTYGNATIGEDSSLDAVIARGGGYGGSSVNGTSLDASGFYTETTYAPSGTFTGGGGGAASSKQRGATATVVGGKAGGAGNGTTNSGGSQGAGGGAGAGGVGGTATTSLPGNGGVGVQSSIATGIAAYYGGGGGGASGGTRSSGGLGGGGAGSLASANGVDGTDGLGGGGGGGKEAGGAGGDGTVIISYAVPAGSVLCTASTSRYTSGGTPYTVVEFDGAGTCGWVPPTGVSSVDVLAVGGGGGGGAWVGGGGGGGGVTAASGVAVTPGTSVPITVGAGGAGFYRGTSTTTDGASGGTSSFGASSAVTALGGGVGATNIQQLAGTGVGVATGGGGSHTSGGPYSAWAAGSGTLSTGGAASTDAQPHAVGGGGGAGGNGGAATGSGSSWASGDGGDGAASTITGTTVYYGGGGGGSAHGTWTTATSWDASVDISPGIGGIGGGGRGGQVTTDTAGTAVVGSDGIDGLGGGGGGAANMWVAGTSYTSTGGTGGDGVVLVRYVAVPAAPTSVSATADAPDQATVTWTAPTYTGGSAITGYTVTSSPDGRTCTPSPATATTCAVTGLTPGTAYTFTVVPANANGSGTASAASSAVTPFGSLDHFAVTDTGGNAVGAQTAGTAFSIKLTAQDSGNRTVTNFTGTAVISSTSLFSAGSGTTAAFTSGVLASHSVNLIRAGAAQTVTATKSGGLEAGTSAGFTINAGSVTKLQTLLPGETAAPGVAGGTSGTPTAVTAGSSVTVTVNAVDANWNVVSSATPTVAITSTDSAAVLPANAALVAGTGTFSVTLKTAGSRTITATDQAGSPLTPSTSASVTVNAAAASQLVVSSIASQVAGTGFAVTATLTDAYGNAVSNTGATGTVTLTRATGTGTVGGTTSGTMAIGSSTVTISGITYSKAEAGVSLTATGTGASSLANGKSGTSNTFTVASGAAASYAVSLSSGTPTAGGTVTVTAQLQDANGNAVATSGRVVTWTTSAAGGSFATATSTTNVSGIATVVYTVSQTSGVSGTVTATDNGTPSRSGVSTSFTTQVGPVSAARSTLTTSASSVSADGTSTVTLTVQAKDQYGNNLTSSGSTVIITQASGSATLGSVSYLAAGAYTATVTAPSTAGSSVFTATIDGSSVQGNTGSTQQVTITYTSGSAVSIAVTRSAAGAASGAAFTTQPQITFRDANGNTVTSDISSVVTATVSAGGTIVGTATATASAGIATFSTVGLSGLAGTYTLTFTSGSLTTTQSILVTVGAATAVVLTTSASGATYGVTWTQQPAIKIVDSGGNTVTSDSLTQVAVTSSVGGTISGTSTITVSSGLAAYSGLAMTGSPANYTLTFAATGLSSATQVLALAQASQVITFAQPAGVTYGVAPYALPATASSGLTVTLTSNNAAVCTVSGLVVTIVGAGTCSLTATQTGNAYYSAAGPVTQTYAVARATQATLTMTSSAAVTFGQSPAFVASGGSGTGALSYSAVDGTATGCSAAGSVLTYTTVGTCIVTAQRASDSNYFQASSSAQTVTVGQAGQTLSFTSTVPSLPTVSGTYTPAASSSSDVTGGATGITPGLAVSGTCSISGGIVTFTSAGTCTVTASAPGPYTNFLGASAVSQVIVVGALNQTIAFTQPSSVNFGGTSFALGATASSGLTVTYATGPGTTNSACTVSSLGVVTIAAVGSCEAVASQAGDSQYSAASPVTRTFQVLATTATSPTVTSASASSQSITLAFTAPSSDGGATITAYRLVATPTGAGSVVATTACSASPCTIGGLVNGTEYTVTVAAVNSAGTGSASSPSTALTPVTAAFAVGALAAVPGDTTVALSWTALTNPQLGGGSFTRYEVSRRVSGTSSWTLVTSALLNQGTAAYTVTGLDNGTSYDFQVVAITSTNTSEIAGNTAQVVEYPSTTPGAPRSLAVLASTPTSVQFSWMAPLSDGGSALTNPNYTVTVTPSGGAAAVTCTPIGAGTNCTASGLTGGATYTFAVVANNRMGAGASASTTFTGAATTDATLASLVVSDGAAPVALSPAFASGTTSYAASVPYAVGAVTLTPTTTSGGATVTVDSIAVTSGSPSSAIALAVGSNAITVVVTAVDPNYVQTYTVTVTRDAASGGSVRPVVPVDPPAPTVPLTPPASLARGEATSVVTENGVLLTDITMVRTAPDAGWRVTGSDFTLTVEGESHTGQPETMASDGALRVPQSGRLAVSGAGYAPDSLVFVFAIPRGSDRASRRGAVRSVPGAVYLGSGDVTASGTMASLIAIPADMRIGDYVLQLNGVTQDDRMRSVNLLLEVFAVPEPEAPAVVTRSTIKRAAFFAGRSDSISLAGQRKLRAMVARIPADATNIRVNVVGVSVSMGTPKQNINLARDRALAIVKFLRARDVQGAYSVSISTTFDIRADRSRDAASIEPDVPDTTKRGKPLTTTTLSFESTAT